MHILSTTNTFCRGSYCSTTQDHIVQKHIPRSATTASIFPRLFAFSWFPHRLAHRFSLRSSVTTMISGNLQQTDMIQQHTSWKQVQHSWWSSWRWWVVWWSGSRIFQVLLGLPLDFQTEVKCLRMLCCKHQAGSGDRSTWGQSFAGAGQIHQHLHSTDLPYQIQTWWCGCPVPPIPPPGTSKWWHPGHMVWMCLTCMEMPQSSQGSIQRHFWRHEMFQEDVWQSGSKKASLGVYASHFGVMFCLCPVHHV